MAARTFLTLSALVWLPYGVLCLLHPTFLAGAAGVAAGSATGLTELRAMYGGLQMAIGTLAGLGALRADLRRPALLALAFLTAGLLLSRLLGVVLDADLSTYTAAALGFEVVSAGLAAGLAAREPVPLAA